MTRGDTRGHVARDLCWGARYDWWCQLKVLKRINFFLWLPKCIWQTFSWVQLAKIDEESTSKWRLYTYHISSWAAAVLLASRGDTPSCHTPRSSASLNGRQGNDGMDLDILCDCSYITVRSFQIWRQTNFWSYRPIHEWSQQRILLILSEWWDG